MRDCEEMLRWYEKRWEEDVLRLKKDKEELQKLLDEQTEEVLALKRERSRWQERESQLNLEMEDLRRELQRTQVQLQTTSAHPPLGEEFFRYLSKELALWDQALLQEAQKLTGGRLLEWMGERWREREDALNLLFAGKEPDWKRLRTGLLLEWALLAWLEGLEDG